MRDTMIELVIERVLAPLFAPVGRIDYLHDLVNEGIVMHLAGKLEMSSDEIGVHLARSRNWAGVILAKARERQKKGGAAADVKLRLAIMSLLVRVHPSALSVRDIAEQVKAPQSTVLSTLEAMRKASVILWDGSKYQAQDKNTVGPILKKRDKVLQSVITVFEVGERYIRGETDTAFQRLHLDLHPEEAPLLIADIRDYVQRRMAQAVANSYQRDPDGLGKTVSLRGVVCLEVEKEEDG